MKNEKIVFIRRREVEARTGMARSTIYDQINRHDFPKPIKIGNKTVVWIESEINEWIHKKIRESRG